MKSKLCGYASRRSAAAVVFSTVLLLIVPAMLSRANAQSPADIPVELFAQLPQVSGLRFSPDGKYFAMIRERNGRRSLFLQPTDGIDRSKVQVLPPSGKFEISWFRWANNDRLIVSLKANGLRQGTPVVETRLIAVPKDDFSDLTYLIKQDRKKIASRLSAVPTRYINIQLQDDVVDFLDDDPDHFLLAIDSDGDGSKELRKVNVWTGEYRDLMGDRKGARHWQTDTAGYVRYMWGVAGSLGRQRYSRYRNSGDTDFVSYDKTTAAKLGLRPGYFIGNSSLAYLWGTSEHGTDTMVKFDFATGEIIETLFENENYDVGGIRLDTVTGEPVAVSYVDDRRQLKYFDKTAARLQRTIDRALPSTVNRIVDSTPDGNLHLIFSSSDVEPGVYYGYAPKNKRIFEMAISYRNLPPELLAPMKRVTYTARDGLEIPAYLTLPLGREPKDLPTVIMPHGGPHARDYIRFDYWTQFLVSRGYAVLQPNFRGSTGYGDAFQKAGRRRWGKEMQDDLTDGTKWLIEEGIADPDRICIVGISYGGYAALMGAVKTPELFACAVSINGATNLPRLIADWRQYIGGRLWAETLLEKGESPRTLKPVSPHHHIGKIKSPILLIAAKDDRQVIYDHSKTMAAALKKAKKKYKYVEIKTGEHSLITEESRRIALMEVEKFLAKYLK